MAELYSAAYHGNVASIRRLLRGGADINWRHPQGGATALYVACEFGHAEAARLLLEAGAPPDQARDDGATPLYKACQDGGRADIAQLLLSKGARVNRADASGVTPLWLACHQGRPQLVRVLLDAGADPSTRVQGWSVLDLARREGREEIVRMLLATMPHAEGTPSATNASRSQTVTPELMVAAHRLYAVSHHGDERGLRNLLAEGAPVNIVSPEWNATALYAAAKEGHTTICKMLLSANAAVDKGHGWGQTPLAAVCSKGNIDMARLLLAADADPEISTRDGGTALSVACYNGHLAIVKLLIEYGAEIERTSADVATPLITASFCGKASCVRALLEEKASLTPTFEGHSALDWATRLDHQSCVQLLKAASQRAATKGSVETDDSPVAPGVSRAATGEDAGSSSDNKETGPESAGGVRATGGAGSGSNADAVDVVTPFGASSGAERMSSDAPGVTGGKVAAAAARLSTEGSAPAASAASSTASSTGAACDQGPIATAGALPVRPSDDPAGTTSASSPPSAPAVAVHRATEQGRGSDSGVSSGKPALRVGSTKPVGSPGVAENPTTPLARSTTGVAVSATTSKTRQPDASSKQHCDDAPTTAEPPLRDFSVVEQRKAHSSEVLQMAGLAIGAVLFSALVMLFVSSAKAPDGDDQAA